MGQNEARTLTVRTLGDLGPNQRLWATCEPCSHSHKLDLVDQRTKYGTRMSLRRIGRMLRCHRRRQQAAKLMLTYTNTE